jgi:hypothetical protein
MMVKFCATGQQHLCYNKSKGHIIVVPQKRDKLYTLLPSPLFDTMSSIKVVWVGKRKPNDGEIRHKLQVRKKEVWKALEWLRAHNPLYSNIDINHEELDRWQDQFVPEALTENIVLLQPEDEGAQREGYAPGVDKNLVFNDDDNEDNEGDEGASEEDLGDAPENGDPISWIMTVTMRKVRVSSRSSG